MPNVTSTTSPREWATAAKCIGMGDNFFVEGAAQKMVTRFCADCPVRRQCLDEALTHRIEWGVWGGLTERERRRLLRRTEEPQRESVAS